MLGWLGLLGLPGAGLVVFSTVSGTATRASSPICSEDSIGVELMSRKTLAEVNHP